MCASSGSSRCSAASCSSRAAAPNRRARRAPASPSAISSAARYDVDRTRCTDDPAAWFIERETTVFVCAARLRDGGCDWYQATLKNAGWDVVLDEKNAGCVLPF